MWDTLWVTTSADEPTDEDRLCVPEGCVLPLVDDGRACARPTT
ncbi:hypothetical protein HALDL1_04745 [Halobacterium sp. DL1]|nr:hypothetical protein HALDL1_04745 [Halobacterium sp. DL1]